jgi:hypothetical protein
MADQFVVVTSEPIDGEHRAVANVYGPFINRLAAEKFRAKHCYEVVACVRPVLRERHAEKFEPHNLENPKLRKKK